MTGIRKWLLSGLLSLSAVGLTAHSLHATDVTLFDNDTYVDSGGGNGAEADNMQASVTSFGHNLSTFTGITAADFTAAFAGNQAFVMPEQENGELNAAIDDAARAAIRDFVQNGGRLIIASDGDNDNSWTPSLLNAVFGFSVTNNQTVPNPSDRLVSGTIFDVAPAQLPDNNATEGLDLASLPADAVAVYGDNTVATVVLIPFGMGDIVFLGYDWFNSDPPNAGGQDGGWQAVFAAALADADLSVTKTASSTDLQVGDKVTFTVTVTNNGPNDAINVTVSDLLPLGLTLDSAIPSQGTCSGNAPIECDLGPLANGASATLDILATASVDGTLANQATVSGAMIDPDTSNNTASAIVTVKTIPPALINGGGCSLTAGLPLASGSLWAGFTVLAGLGAAWRRMRSSR